MDTTAPAAGHGLVDATGTGYRRLVVGLTGVILAAAFGLSATALAAVAAWAGVTGPLTWAMAVLLDAGVLAATATALHERPRGQRGRVAASWAVVGILTLLSAGLNAAHAWATTPVVGWQRVAGAVLAAVPPLVVWASSHALAWVLTTTDAEREAAAEAAAQARVTAARREARARAAVARAEAEHAPAPVAAPEPVVPATPAVVPPARVLVAPTTAPAPARSTSRVVVDDTIRARVAALRSEGMSERAIAASVGLSKSAVHRVCAEVASDADVVVAA